MRLGTIVLLSGICTFIIAAPAYAYVDPGTGSMLVQVVTGGVAGFLVLMRLYWTRIKAKFSGSAAPTAADRRPGDPASPTPRAK